MTNRVLLDVGGLKVSRAGANVLSTSDANLLFNSDYRQPSVHTRGMVSRSSPTTVDISFGKTFSTRPLVTWLVARAGPGWDGLGHRAFQNDYAWFVNDGGSGTSPSMYSWARIFNNRIRWRNGNGTNTAYYIVWDVNI